MLVHPAFGLDAPYVPGIWLRGVSGNGKAHNVCDALPPDQVLDSVHSARKSAIRTPPSILNQALTGSA